MAAGGSLAGAIGHHDCSVVVAAVESVADDCGFADVAAASCLGVVVSYLGAAASCFAVAEAERDMYESCSAMGAGWHRYSPATWRVGRSGWNSPGEGLASRLATDIC